MRKLHGEPTFQVSGLCFLGQARSGLLACLRSVMPLISNGSLACILSGWVGVFAYAHVSMECVARCKARAREKQVNE